ncbi:MAG: GNAT family N-acetyltransferase [Anaerolineae bacterium]|nr:GNAT family N-acetyltransferase [Anaerolineae bacterium]
MAIDLITNTPAAAEALFKMNHAFHTNYAWQMNRKVNTEELAVQFQRVRLPREMLVQPRFTYEEQVIRNNNADIVLVAMKEDNAIGYVVLQEDQNANMVSIVDLVVRQNHRRKGIGTMLLEGAQDWTSHCGCQRLVSDVTTKNDPAIRLLTHCNFDYCGFQEFFSAKHDIVLFYGIYLR